MNISVPTNKKELMERASTLNGITTQQLANKLNKGIPNTLTHAKGWLGNLLEEYLGAEAASAAKPDFIDLGIELKTLPLNDKGKPKESTYVCVVQLEPSSLTSWKTSLVKHKLSEVLWIPYEAHKDIPISNRRIGTPFLWKPNQEQEKQLKQDWEEICDMIVLGELNNINSSMGNYLQIRPKAANAKSLTVNKNEFANKYTLPRGFYLRSSFTETIIP